MTEVVGFAGFSGSGKTTAAEALEEDRFMRLSFAAPVKELFRRIDPKIDGELLSSLDKSVNDLKRSNPDVLRMLRNLGLGLRELFGEDLLVEFARRRMQSSPWVHYPIVFDDVRFSNEVELIHGYGGIVVWVERPGVKCDGHPIETMISRDQCDYLIVNDGSVNNLRGKVWGVVCDAFCSAVLG